MATWPPQRSKQNCLAAQPKLSLKGFSVYPSPRSGGLHGALTHALNSPRTQARTRGWFLQPKEDPHLEKPEWSWADRGQEVAGAACGGDCI